MGMGLEQLAEYQSALNNPEGAMVKWLESGGVLDNDNLITQAENHLRTLKEDWIPDQQDARREKMFAQGNFDSTAEGQQLLARIERYKEWITVLEARHQGRKEGNQGKGEKISSQEQLNKWKQPGERSTSATGNPRS